MQLIQWLKTKLKVKAKEKGKEKINRKLQNRSSPANNSKTTNTPVANTNNKATDKATDTNNKATEKPKDGKIRKFIAARIIDGDTFQTDKGDRVRLIGLDAAEIGEPGADEATEFLRMLIAGKPVWLEPDGNEKDRWGRYRSYVWMEKPKNINDEKEIRKNQVNAKILEAGHAEVRIIGQVRHEELFNRIAKKK